MHAMQYRVCSGTQVGSTLEYIGTHMKKFPPKVIQNNLTMGGISMQKKCLAK